MSEIKEHTYKWYTFGCKDASYLKVKSSFHKLNLSEKILYHFHLFMCKYCRRFSQQIQKLDDFIKNSSKTDSLTMSESKKALINQQIKQFLTKN